MEDTIRTALDEVIEKEIRELSNFRSDSDEKKKAIDNLSTLYKLRIEEAKIDLDAKNADLDRDAKAEQAKSQAKDRMINVIVQCASVGLTLIAYDVWNKRGLLFEEKGTITSPMTRNLYSKMIPKLF